MKLKRGIMKLGLLFTGILALGAAHSAPLSPMDGYTPSVVSKDSVSTIWSSMRDSDITSSSICSNRANVWSYEMKKDFDIDSKKFFIYYTPSFIHFAYDDGVQKSRYDRTYKVWYYHVAPAINVEGDSIILDKLFGKKPQTEQEWKDQFLKRANKRLNNPVKRSRIISRIKRSISDLRGRNLSRDESEKLAKDERTLELIYSTPKVNGKYKVACKPITHVSEHYFDKNAWCHTQYTSMFYWNPRSLRYLNYGSSKIIRQSSYTEKAIEKGKRYQKTEFSKRSLSQSYMQAFDISF